MTKDCGCGNKAKQTMQNQGQYRPAGFSGYQPQQYQQQPSYYNQGQQYNQAQQQPSQQWQQYNQGQQYNQQYTQQSSQQYSQGGGFSGYSTGGQRVNPRFQGSSGNSNGQSVTSAYTPKPCSSCGRH